ncbi:MAG: phosphatase PAP2 family protein [Acidimicrobiaceae bacterium]|nr:phosphatase PAP2 family protein [Acidimicrobiaceae bacterium]
MNTRRLHWWVEVLTIAAFYGIYSLIRDIHGTNTDSVAQATTNAHRLVDLERDLGVFREAWMQHLVLGNHAFVSFWDDYYATVHFLAVAGMLIWLFFVQPRRYRFWRNVIALCTALALIGFAFFPVLPPRLLPSSYDFVDTLKVVGGLWNFSSGAVNSVSNQYAAMPSLHTAWSTWVSLALWPSLRHWWAKVATLAYPAATIYCIVVTGNHYFADAAGGLLFLGAAYLLTRAGHSLWHQHFGEANLLSVLRPRVHATADR